MKKGDISNRDAPYIGVEWPVLFRTEKRGRFGQWLLGDRVVPSQRALHDIGGFLGRGSVGQVFVFGLVGSSEASGKRIRRAVEDVFRMSLLSCPKIFLFDSVHSMNLFFAQWERRVAFVLVADEQRFIAGLPLDLMADTSWVREATWHPTRDTDTIIKAKA